MEKNKKLITIKSHRYKILGKTWHLVSPSGATSDDPPHMIGYPFITVPTEPVTAKGIGGSFKKLYKTCTPKVTNLLSF